MVTADYKASAGFGGEDNLITLGLSPLLHNYKHTPSPTLGYVISALCWDRGTLLEAGKVSTEVAGHPFLTDLANRFRRNVRLKMSIVETFQCTLSYRNVLENSEKTPENSVRQVGLQSNKAAFCIVSNFWQRTQSDVTERKHNYTSEQHTQIPVLKLWFVPQFCVYLCCCYFDLSFDFWGIRSVRRTQSLR